MVSKRTTMWLPGELKKRLAASSDQSLSDGIREVSERYFTILDRSRAEIRDVFTPAEMALICDVCNGTMFTAPTLDRCILADAEDTEDTIYTKWRVKREVLIGKLESLTLSQNAALVDAVERFWRATGTGFTPEFKDLLK